MNKKSYLAGLLILPLGAAEVIESEHPLLAALRQPSLESGTSYTLAGNPHTHCDVETGVCATTAAPFSASGARRAEEIFRLHVIPQQTGGIRLIAFPALNLWVTAPSETQNMYGFCETVDALCELLASRLGLPQSQLEALRGEHQHRFPQGVFVHEIDKQIAQSSGHDWLGRIDVTREGLREAISPSGNLLRVPRFSVAFLTGAG